jgi:hypothetical protein
MRLSVHSCCSRVGLRPSISNGNRMLARTSSVGTRLNDWNTNPTRRRRSTVSSASSIPLISVAPTKTRPLVTESNPAMMCMSVDLPEPLGPITAVKRPAGIPTVTPSSAMTRFGPDP